MSYQIPIGRLSKTFLLIKLIQLIIIYFTPIQFDTSSQIIISKLSSPSIYIPNIFKVIIDKVLVWDSVYFNDLFVNEYKYEHQYVFCPSWLSFIRNLPGPSLYYDKFIISLIFSNIFHYLSIIVLYYLTIEVFNGRRPHSEKDQLSQLSSIYLIISTAGVFLTINYSENLCNFLSYLALLTYYKGVNYNDVTKSTQRSKKSIRNYTFYFLSGIIIAINFTVRANTLLMGVIYLIDVYDFYIVSNDLNSTCWSIITGLPLFFTFVITNIRNYLQFCPQRGEWCNSRLPILFSFVQQEYWNNGFLTYWTINNIPNFLLIIPTLLIQIQSIHYFYIELPRIKKVFPVLILTILVNIGAVFFWNAQILTRVVTFLPLSFWYCSIHYIEEKTTTKLVSRTIAYYNLGWIFLQTSLLAAFLPPA
ncbi:GPI mannosyltransferase 2 [Scheffersomyces amazonensis]|uniref:GPI mannosyltransferase 2 n=1 Tax=Scheffersomyces amazonensis TaxID=1078765 RepID=UPI00315C5A1C